MESLLPTCIRCAQISLQKTFKSSYVARLKDELRAHPATLEYSYDSFEVDPTMVRQLANVYHPENLPEQMMNAQSEFEAAVALYKAYKNVSPLLASNETFWVYLTHAELLPYCQKTLAKCPYSPYSPCSPSEKTLRTAAQKNLPVLTVEKIFVLHGVRTEMGWRAL